jgi:hypothetical protein
VGLPKRVLMEKSPPALDFPQLLALSSAAGPGLILFRGGNYSDAEMCELLDVSWQRYRRSSWKPRSVW